LAKLPGHIRVAGDDITEKYLQLSNILAGLLHFKSLDDFATNYGPKWAYHLGPVLPLIVLPYYDDMKLARMDSWDLKDEQGEPWPWLDLTPSAEAVRKSHLQAFVV